jgi:DMSO/TMAO reductase YedYZ molybdopterin-dependent catalytic subunit
MLGSLAVLLSLDRCFRIPAMNDHLLRVEGQVATPLSLSFADLCNLPESAQVRDVSRIDPKRQGNAVKLSAVLERAQPAAEVRHLTLHASRDDFHASIPLDAVRDKAILIYCLDGAPLPSTAGGPVRFYIPDFAACHTAEIDECANVKFVDRIELTRERGPDNRPHDSDEHEKLHERERRAH